MAGAPLMEEEEAVEGEEERVPETPSVQSVLLIGEGGIIRVHDEPCYLEFDSGEGLTSVTYIIPIIYRG